MLAHNYEDTYLPPDLSNQDSSDQNADYSQDYYDDATPSKRKIGKWTAEEDKLLRKYVPMYGEKQWRKISDHIPGRTSIQCLHRWTKILKPGLVKGPWTAEEDQKLISWVRAEGPTKWAQAANFIVGRSGKQCRERWFNNLSPNVKKGNWSKEEDELIYELYQKYGTSWSKIAKYISGRTENAIKNRFYSTLRKLAADKRKIRDEVQNNNESQKTDMHDDESPNMPPASPMDPMNIDPPNRLYKLLQAKTYPADSASHVHTAKSVQEREPMQEDTHNHHMEEPVTNHTSTQKTQQQHQQQQQQQHEVPRDGDKTLPKQQQESKKAEPQQVQISQAALAQIEIGENEWEFEKFLLKLDAGPMGEDYQAFTKQEPRNELADPVQFDNLQQKILNYCHDNIHSLSEAFKTMAHNQNDMSPPSDAKTRSRTITQIVPNHLNNSGFKIEAGNGGFYQENIKGIKISAPIPVTRISFNKKTNLGNSAPQPVVAKETSTGGNNGINFNSFLKHEEEHGQGYAIMPQMISSITSPMKGFESPQIDAFDIFGQRPGGGVYDPFMLTPIKNRSELLQQQNKEIKNNTEWENVVVSPRHGAVAEVAVANGGTKEGEDSVRMNFLFEQLYSLEGLLANARNELLKLEKSLNDGGEEGKKGKDENIARMKLGEMFGGQDDLMEQLVKKRKQT